MLKNEKNIFDKLLLITFLALICSFLSALYISSAQAADIAPNEIQMPGTSDDNVDIFDALNLSTIDISANRD